MHTYIALFRGINVGGNRLLPMKELVSIVEETGGRSVKTYIQSGNAVFHSPYKEPASLAAAISLAVEKRSGFAPQVVVLRIAELEKAMAKNPFPDAEEDPASLHLGFLASVPKNPDLEKLEAIKKESERFHLSDTVFYLHAPEGVGRSQLAARSETLLGVPMTDRNWRTVCKIWDLAKGPDK